MVTREFECHLCNRRFRSEHGRSRHLHVMHLDLSWVKTTVTFRMKLSLFKQMESARDDADRSTWISSAIAERLARENA